MEYEPVWALLLTIPALPEVLHDPVVSNPGFWTRFPPARSVAGTKVQKDAQINATKFFIRVEGAKSWDFLGRKVNFQPYSCKAEHGCSQASLPCSTICAQARLAANLTIFSLDLGIK